MLFVIRNRNTGEYYRDPKQQPDLVAVMTADHATLYAVEFDVDNNGAARLVVTPALPFDETWLNETDPLCTRYEMVPVKIKPTQEL